MHPSFKTLTFSRACAFVFAVGGTLWAMLVAMAQAMALASPREGAGVLLYFLPGWLVYFGWVCLATGRGVEPLSPRWFWILSAVVNLGYFTHEYQPWRYLGDYERSLSSGAYWWLATGFLSIVCAVFPGARTAGDPPQPAAGSDSDLPGSPPPSS